MGEFDGLELGLGNLARLSNAQTRSISPENPSGAKGAGSTATDGTGARHAGELGVGWKINPCVQIAPGQEFIVADIPGPGAIQHIWLTPTGHWRFSVLRIWWDEEEEPSVEVPLADFFCQGWCRYAAVSSLAVCVNPASGFNCYWQMPFRKSCRMTVSNLDDEPLTLYYQVGYTLTDVPSDRAYLHAQFRRSNPVPYGQVHTILDEVRGRGHFVGTYTAWGSNSAGWWGEGEIKFFLDGDAEFPTICGTGTEDYFGGSYGFVEPASKRYAAFSTPYSGMPQVIVPDGQWQSQMRFGLYRWHIMDPIRFQQELRATIQALGWRKGGKYLPLQDDVATTAFWYQQEPHATFPPLPARDELEVI